MKDEIKEILDTKLYFDLEEEDYIKIKNYITNLQQENKEWGMIFDTFSSRPYAHRYLEEKRKELGNKRIMGLDSEMIYKEYYDLKEIEQEHKKINGELREENSKLEIALQNIQEDYDKRVEENERLKAIWKDTNVIVKDNKSLVMNTNAYDTLQDYKSRCEKASEKLGNYKHYSTPTEEQNSENEDIVDSALNILQNGSDSK